MSHLTTPQPTVEVKAQPNVYTVLLIVAILALALAAAVVGWKLMSLPPTGYGMEIGDLFEKIMPPSP